MDLNGGVIGAFSLQGSAADPRLIGNQVFMELDMKLLDQGERACG